MTSLRAPLVAQAALLVIVVVAAVVSVIWLLLLADWRVLATSDSGGRRPG